MRSSCRLAQLHEAASGLEISGFRVPDSWATRIQQVAAGELGAAEALVAVEENGLIDLVSDEQAFAAVTASVENAASSGRPDQSLMSRWKRCAGCTRCFPSVSAPVCTSCAWGC